MKTTNENNKTLEDLIDKLQRLSQEADILSEVDSSWKETRAEYEKSLYLIKKLKAHEDSRSGG